MPEEMVWDCRIRPPADLCPREFCFRWVPAGGQAEVSGRTFRNFREASREGTWVNAPPEGMCTKAQGCSRLNPGPGYTDLYSSDDLALEKAGLPWFYFIADLRTIVRPQEREQALEAARQLWGRLRELEPGS